MRTLLLSACALFGLAAQAQAYTIDEYTAFAPLPSTYAPTALVSSPLYEQNVTTSIPNVRLSPFEGTSYAGRAFDAVESNGSATFAASSFGESSGARGTFTFVYGSPDSYNTLVFNLLGGGTLSLSGSDIGATPQNGYYLTRISGIGAYSSVTFGTGSTNAFEFAALSTVPLPASAPMFGGALLALAGLGYGAKRRKAAAAA